MPSQIPGHAWSYDFIPFRIPTIYRMTGFYLFCCLACGVLRAYLVKDKSAKELVVCLKDLHTWCAQYGHKLSVLRQDSGSTENSEEVRECLGSFPISVDNSGTAAPEFQRGNPIERLIQAFMKLVAILLNSTPNYGAEDWGIAVLAACDFFNATMGERAEFLSDGTKTRLQMITNHPRIIPTCPIEFGAIVTAPYVGKTSQSSPPNDILRYVMPGNPGTHTDIVVRHYTRNNMRLMVRYGLDLLIWSHNYI